MASYLNSLFQCFGDGAQPRVRHLVHRGEGHNPARRTPPARDAEAQPHPGAARISGGKGIVQRGASYLLQGFDDNALGSSPS